MPREIFKLLRYGCRVVSTDYTKQTMENNGFISSSIVYTDDMIGTANRLLSKYSKKDAEEAYLAYDFFYRLSLQKEEEFMEKVRSLFKD
ncbi:MAG: hypothetical protein QXT45_00985 [Candidatus Bilamarchaeaceae archaeon]